MIFAHTSLIQEGEAALFYNFSNKLNGYVIAGILIAPNFKAKMDFVTIWKYFVSEVVRKDDIYCSLVVELDNSILAKYLQYHDTIKGIKIYKVDNYIKNQYSEYAKHVERTTSQGN